MPLHAADQPLRSHGILASVKTLSRVRWLPVLVFVLNGCAILLAVFNPDRIGTSFVLAVAALCFAVLEGVQSVAESARTRTRNPPANPVGRGR